MVAKKGPPSALEGGEGSAKSYEEPGAQSYSVQVHTEDKGLEVKYYTAKTGDEAAQKALAAEGYANASIRGVTPASDPDANSLGGEREAAVMIQNAHNPGSVINSLGTEANAKATEELGKADVTELKD